MHHETLNPTSD